MNLWIVTIGSSDVQPDSDKTNQEKGRTERQRSNKVWSYWYNDDLKSQNYDISFEPKPLFQGREEFYRISPRILGLVYKANPEKIQEEIWSYLTFPLLDVFVHSLTERSLPKAIAVLLTDQSQIFSDSARRRKPQSPYWQDTCELEPILKLYFEQKFPGVDFEPILLAPVSQEQSLDNWNAVLDLVRDKFRNLKIADQEVKIIPGEQVYVSHQAGTPAISSAIQFVSLATFRDNVQFLISNEDTGKVVPISQSTYLGAIRQQEAKALLKRYDYSGVRDLLGLTQATPLTHQEKELIALVQGKVKCCSRSSTQPAATQ